ncbi:MAG TPA: phage holin family protein [Candidatus Dormibacteraeota bacterium]|nr:phage holin family protein [Candidatus Dormibacteraeota bacterium]
MESRERSIGELISELVRKASVLVQEEVALARSEMSTKASTVSRSAGMIVGGGVIAYGGFLAVVAAIIIALHAVMPWWAAALLVGLVLVAVGYFLIHRALQTIKTANLAPRRTLASLRGYREVGTPVSPSAFSRQR